MTKASEVTISDAEIDRFDDDEAAALAHGLTPTEARRIAAAKLIAARVPDAMLTPCNTDEARAHNSLRDAVLRGPG